MRKIVFWLVLMVLVIVGSACTSLMGEAEPASVNDSVFKLSIHIDKDEYAADEAVNCYATLEYVGGADGITIYSGDPLVYFSINGGKFTGDYAISDILKSTTLKKHEPVRFDFVKSGGFSANDKDASFWEGWFADPELKLPAGTYTVSATVEGFFDENDYEGTDYKLTASQNITVLP